MRAILASDRARNKSHETPNSELCRKLSERWNRSQLHDLSRLPFFVMVEVMIDSRRSLTMSRVGLNAASLAILESLVDKKRKR